MQLDHRAKPSSWILTQGLIDFEAPCCTVRFPNHYFWTSQSVGEPDHMLQDPCFSGRTEAYSTHTTLVPVRKREKPSLFLYGQRSLFLYSQRFASFAFFQRIPNKCCYMQTLKLIRQGHVLLLRSRFPASLNLCQLGQYQTNVFTCKHLS